jgi:hypothetical protein
MRCGARDCRPRPQSLERSKLQAELRAKLRAFQKQGRKHQKYERERLQQASHPTPLSDFTVQRLKERCVKRWTGEGTAGPCFHL